MFATLLTIVRSRHRAWAFALLWLLALTILNVQTSGAYRHTVFFAIPVAVVAWSDWQLGLLFAALAVGAAKYGNAMPEPGSPSPAWLDGTLAFVKLSMDAAVASAWGRRVRMRRGEHPLSEELHDRGSR